ncbi:MAG: DUF362 domain-containing protein [Prolixibacteraceae bacterium]|jgi:uncharacterized protein (DUF362 family)|nr:DUF362 domain-containing protein [Prolixibacteraceae bacterium]
MKTTERFEKLPGWIQKTILFLTKTKIPAKVIFILTSVLATAWFIIRVVPKPSRALYPCMQVAAPIMSSFVIWILTLSGSVMAFKKAKNKLFEAKYAAAFLFLVIGLGSASVFTFNNSTTTSANELEIWYKPNIPLGEAKGIFPGRVAWAHNPNIASWDGKTGFWWEDTYNKQNEVKKLLAESLFQITNKQNEKEAWAELFTFYNKTKQNKEQGYKAGEKIAIKVNMNNTDAQANTNRINANPQLVLSLLTSLINEAGVKEENIIVSDPSRFITDNIYDKCHVVFPKVRFEDHNGGNGRDKATFVENSFEYSFDFDGQTRGLATSFVEADYIINMALLKGHVSQGVTLNSKNFFGCVDIETDWRKNTHGSGFSQSREGKRQYSVYPDFIGHKNLGDKTILYLIDGIYGHKFVDGVPEFKWALAPFNNEWPNSLFASQDPVAIESVALDFALTEWPDAPDMMYSDHAMEEMALAHNPPSGVVYDPERDGTRLKSLGVTEHWNNENDKQYSRNLGKDQGIELIYALIKK